MLKAIIPCAFALTVIVHNTKAHAFSNWNGDDYRLEDNNSISIIVFVFAAWAFYKLVTGETRRRMERDGSTYEACKRHDLGAAYRKRD